MASGDAEVRSRLQVLTLFIHFGYSLGRVSHAAPRLTETVISFAC
jgi:hypothetical protein